MYIETRDKIVEEQRFISNGELKMKCPHCGKPESFVRYSADERAKWHITIHSPENESSREADIILHNAANWTTFYVCLWCWETVS